MATFTVYVPTDLRNHNIGCPAGTAIVSPPLPPASAGEPDERVVTYIEGDIYKRGMAFEEKVFHASDRCNQHYPTVAIRALRRSELRPVASYNLATRELYVEDQPALDAWLAHQETPLT